MRSGPGMELSGGLTPDNIGVEYAGVVFSIEESPLTPGLVWAGTNDGLIHVTRDGGATWADVTDNVPGMPEWGAIRNIEASRHDEGTAYFAVDGHQANDRDPWIYRTRDYGASWELIVDGIPPSPLSYTHAVTEDPVRPGLLYAGTENGLYVSLDDGDRWQPLQSNLPHAPVYWMVVQKDFNDLVVGTYGRGFWILDDISALQQLTPEVAVADAHLFRSRSEYRLRPTVPPYAEGQDPVAGDNPPYGASIDYWIGEDAAVGRMEESSGTSGEVRGSAGAAGAAGPAEAEATAGGQASAPDSVTLEVVNAGGEVVRTLKGGRRARINRVWWDLRHDPSKEPVLRTKPLHAPWVELGPDGTRSAPGLGTVSQLALPGAYTVRLTVDGGEHTQPLEVVKDPNSGGTLAEVRESFALVSRVVVELDRAVEVINGAERVRAQLQELRRVYDGEGRADLREAARELEQRFTDVEGKLYQLRTTGRGQDVIRWPMRLAQQIQSLAGKVESSDFAPTEQQRAVHEELRAELAEVVAEYDALGARELAVFNRSLEAEGVAGVSASGG